ncbi:hypothetical protein [Deinococcus sp.]|uniref:hypothetical protein n=1 Tax=Deinococcus sp. TaxID=47478 RepID=UPI0025BD6AAF|nr:hypothetical protein [Deinococcus sp.]
MKKLLVLLALGGLSTAAAATPDCGTPVLLSLRTLVYRTKAEFPDSPKEVRTNFWEQSKPMTLCGVIFAKKGNTFVVKADKNDYLGYLTTPARTADGITLAGSTPGLFGYSGLSVDLTLLNLYTMYSARARIPTEMSAGTAVGIRIDGGKLQPLYWPGKGGSPVEFSKKSRIVDVYVKTNMPTNWERVTVDLANHTLTVYP